MKKIIILTPIFNDWPSLEKLIFELNSKFSKLNDYEFKMIVIDDGSTVSQPKINKPVNFTTIEIINMKENRGHAECIAYGLGHIIDNENFDKVILMDGDGEDRPEEIEDLLDKAFPSSDISVVAKRIKRSEGPVFTILYHLHKLLTLIFTGKKINFGNFSCISKKDILKIKNKSSLWSSYSGTFKKNIKNYEEINCVRGKRYFGPSKMSLFKLLLHSFSIIAVFKYEVFLRSIIIFLFFFFFKNYFGIIVYIPQLFVILFSLLIFAVSLKNEKNLRYRREKDLNKIKKTTI